MNNKTHIQTLLNCLLIFERNPNVEKIGTFTPDLVLSMVDNLLDRKPDPAVDQAIKIRNAIERLTVLTQQEAPPQIADEFVQDIKELHENKSYQDLVNTLPQASTTSNQETPPSEQPAPATTSPVESPTATTAPPIPVKQGVNLLSKTRTGQAISTKASAVTTKAAGALGKVSFVSKIGGGIRAVGGVLGKLGAFIPGGGWLATIAIEFGTRFLRWVRNNRENLAGAAMGLAAGSLIVPTLIIPAAALGGAAFWAGGTSAFAGGLSSIFAGIAAVFSATLTVIITPIIISIIVIPLLLAFTILIITNSAWIVPPSTPIIPGVYSPGSGPGGAYPMCWPTYGSIVQGPRCETDNYTHCNSFNLYGPGFGNAIDIAWTKGTPIYATHNGTATAHGVVADYGYYVTITSTDGSFRTLYAHMDYHIFSGTVDVVAGDLIGYMGNTGKSDGPHLHYEIRPTGGIDINNAVPSYNISQVRDGIYPLTSGCFAKDQGGSNHPPGEQ